jgi:hypothetical protein
MLLFLRGLLTVLLGSLALALFVGSLTLSSLSGSASADDGSGGPDWPNCYFECGCDALAQPPKCETHACNQPSTCNADCKCVTTSFPVRCRCEPK